MSDPIQLYHASPKELVVVTVTVNGAVVTSAYQLCILKRDVTPVKTDSFWQAPDTAAPDTGIFVGPDTTKVFAAGDVAVVWYWYTGSPESIIEPATTPDGTPVFVYFN